MARKTKRPWPTKDAMEQIYDKHLWGGSEFDFYSGEGSYNPEIITPYLDTVEHFLKSFNNTLTVCDLGCGDFNVGSHLVKHVQKYMAIDIVKPLIHRNKSRFKNENLKFYCLDIAKDELPPADCVILRQVLQHLSNTEIQQVVKKIANYKYIILTEHLPSGNFVPNKDIISGQGIRLKKHSGVDIMEGPFHFKIKNKKLLCESILENNKGCITTTLYQIF
ncbi:class I SAM-dependent methyltransferase [uncultured Algibacter sp.]|uniref:class I SAM-dependent methyltransferase n=1 Tax=uncultured Algibacter sp. TaxID=298659 RepID=UPI00260ACE27|nr:class I SAM-dependent methyltransferase [uncultured Algibacter sp.]